jgi:Flp pilus assembly CpaE family ATPase
MVAELAKKGDTVKGFTEIARSLAGRRNGKKSRSETGLNTVLRKLLGR